MRSRYLLTLSIVAVSALGVGRASADVSPEDQALATTLFKEAKALIEAGKVSEACPKLVESQRLHPAGGTLLNLAVCHEREGKTATAWAELREARLVAERDGRADRIELADEHLKALEPKLSKVVINVPPAVDVADMEIRADDRVLRRPAWGTAIPVDPGEHVIEAVAPGKKRWHTSVTVLPDADLKTVVVPDWEDDGAAPVSPPVTPPVTLDQPLLTSRDRTAALIVGGIGLVGIGFGSYFGLRAIGKHNDAQDACTTDPCPSASRDLSDTAKTSADIATVAFAIGIAGLGVGTYLWFFTGESTSTGARSVRVVPAIGPGRQTVDLTARF